MPSFASEGIPRAFWIYLAGAALVAAGYADFPLIAYHFAKDGVIAPALVPVLYAVAMAAAGLTALLAGRLFDRVGLSVVAVGTLLSAAFAPLVFLGGAPAAVVGTLLWGAGMGVHDSIVRAAVAGMVPPDRRAAAYGWFGAGFGVCWFLGSAVMGVLYDRSVMALVVFSLVAQLAAVPVIIVVARRLGRPAMRSAMSRR